ncbi:MAG: YdiU family protein [Aeromicrobium sp.]|nr:YdiU family protein [Burkholderiales bacterium]
MLTFDNRFLRELPGDAETTNTTRQVKGAVWSRVLPTPVLAPRMIAYSHEMAATLGLDAAAMQRPEIVNALGGNGLLPGSEPYATVYGGHQFGHWAGQLGDGRAIYLGEVVNTAGQHHELQLKGAGPTPYSRRADGRAVLRSSIREFLCSEAMFHLGIPTTRALSLVATGDKVVRDMFYDGNPEREPGAIVCRVAPSFTRFGHFEIHAARNDTALLRQLVDFTIARDFAELDLPREPIERVRAWFGVIAERTAIMVAHWMRVGFVHGVMNTDNMSILGLTIDYGPYGWIDNFDPGWTPNTTDAEGKRYCYGRQPEIARWNLERLGSALLMLTDEGSAEANRFADLLQAGMNKYDETFDLATRNNLAGKFGFASWREQDTPLVNDAFRLLAEAEVDMTLFFRRLADIGLDAAANRVLLADAFYRDDLRENHQQAFDSWLGRYLSRIKEDDFAQSDRAGQMNRFNPLYVMRNYLAQQAIDLATAGDNSMVVELLDVMRKPYEAQPGRERFAEKRPDWARQKAGCSMLSCSS